jgi:3-dehydroquinate synthase
MPERTHKSSIAGSPVLIGKGVFSALKARLRKQGPAPVFILVDSNTLEACLPRLVAEVPALAGAEIIEVNPGEQSKSIRVCENLWAALAELGAGRNSLFISLGGGVITDLGGFVASCYMRGIPSIHIPTSLLGMADAALGGKTGVDLDHVKNLVGTFSHPEMTLIYPGFLKSLPPDHLSSGLGEVLKHALIGSPGLWKLLREAGDGLNWEVILKESLAVKKAIVDADPREKGPRKLLNFGHTIGHALESLSLESETHPMLHGHAVIAGMVCEAWISRKKKLLAKQDFEEVFGILNKFRTSWNFNKFDEIRLFELMKLDKKNNNAGLNFTLLTGIGKGKINQYCEPGIVKEALKFYRELPLPH